MSVTEIDFADDAFDVVLCNHVLEHVRDDARAMKEILRVLRPGGYAILQVPIDHSAEATHEDPTFGPEERAWHYRFADHVRLYGMDYKDWLAAVGFEVDVNWYVRNVEATRLALDPDEEIFVCHKPRRHWIK